ncbi:MAG TPA: hypothetical protein VFT89_09365, partial [Rhizobiaceae bacterium]|nr:hypothetical protein [Rhizobiaceae bacterium]
MDQQVTGRHHRSPLLHLRLILVPAHNSPHTPKNRIEIDFIVVLKSFAQSCLREERMKKLTAISISTVA